MGAMYSYQVDVGGIPGPLISVSGDRVSGTVFGGASGPPGAVRDASATVLAWYAKIRELEGSAEGNLDGPFESSVTTLGASGKYSLSFRAGSLVRKATYDPKAKTIASEPAAAFECSVASWKAMHATYAILCRLAEGA